MEMRPRNQAPDLLAQVQENREIFERLGGTQVQASNMLNSPRPIVRPRVGLEMH